MDRTRLKTWLKTWLKRIAPIFVLGALAIGAWAAYRTSPSFRRTTRSAMRSVGAAPRVAWASLLR